LCYQKGWLKGYKEIAPKRIYIGNNTIMETISMGNVEIGMSIKDEIIDAIFNVFVFASKIV
jgi:ABC-type Fe3+ transport system substrate-binding protein